MSRSIGLLQGLGALAETIQGDDDSRAKGMVFSAIVGLITEIPFFRTLVSNLRFLDPPLCIMPLGNGTCAYTFCKMQMNVHFLIAHDKNMLEQCMTQLLQLCAVSPLCDFAIDMSPLQMTTSCLSGPCFRRRFGLSRSVVPILEDGNMIYDAESETRIPASVISDCSLALHTPLTRLCAKHLEEPDTLFWTRTVCGSIVGFKNLIMPEETMPTVEAITRADGPIATFSISLQKFFNALQPTNIEDAYETIQNPETRHISPVLVWVCCHKFGMQDGLINIVGSLMAKKLIQANPLHRDIFELHQLLQRRRRISAQQAVNIVEKLCTSTFSSSHESIFNTWLVQSARVRQIICVLPIKAINRITSFSDAIVSLLIDYIYCRIGSWASWERETVAWLKATPIITERGRRNWEFILVENERVNRYAKACTEQLIRTVSCSTKTNTSPTSSTSSASPSTVSSAASPVVPATSPPAPPNTHTHKNIVACLNAKWPVFKWTLIGSGVFFDDGDVDVVVEVPGSLHTTLQDAYDTVQTETGFQMQGKVDNEHVAILTGMFRGYPIEAQVTRCDGTTVSESQSEIAIRLTQRFCSETSETIRNNVTELHRFFNAAGLKGHTLCRLPGLSVTCIAIRVSSEQPRANLVTQLQYLLTILRSGVQIDFDETCAQEGFAKHSNKENNNAPPMRPLVPLTVIVHERNIATRVTAAWSRHLLDTVAYALHLEAECRFAPEAYHTWRTRHMAICAILRGKGQSSLACSLLKALSKLEGHPIIEAFHIENGKCGDVIVMGTINSNASLHYGFQATHRIKVVTGCDFVEIHKGNKSWRLCTSISGPGPDIASSPYFCKSVSSWIATGNGRRIPNAPTLSVDTVACFDSRFWEETGGRE